MKVKVSLSLFILIFLFSSCNHTKNQTASSGFTGDYIIATIETDSIYISEIDKLAKQELYDQLYRIYIIRKVVLNETINNRLLEAEAKRNGKSKDEFISEYYRCMVNDRNIAKYSDKRNFQYIPELKRTLKYYDIKSEKGKELIIESYKRYLLERLTDSLKLVHKINIFLKPPLPPEISLNNIPAHYRGNMDSKITLLEVSDMECDKCREYYPVYEKLYNKYKDKVRFGFTHFASY
ncbi:MAG: thioredoxin domain-containing protein, partial [Bacteroidia bacterium]|nr:thioredoxin domain-containing protein [Bacteroidia bacterium]